MRGATETFGLLDDDTAFQSTLPMRGATCGGRKMRRRDDISIHAPHAGSDCTTKTPLGFALISIHAPHAGSDG